MFGGKVVPLHKPRDDAQVKRQIAAVVFDCINPVCPLEHYVTKETPEQGPDEDVKNEITKKSAILTKDGAPDRLKHPFNISPYQRSEFLAHNHGHWRTCGERGERQGERMEAENRSESEPDQSESGKTYARAGTQPRRPKRSFIIKIGD